MQKTRYTLIVILGLFALGACHTILKTSSNTTLEPVSLQPITTDIPLPTTDIAFLLPETPELNKVISPRKNINENFSQREKNDVAVPDPVLMADSKSLIIDLASIQTEDFAFPLPGAKVISGFGGRRRNHTGVDIKTCANDTVLAAFDGIVRLAKSYYGYGNLVVIRHYNGLETLYSHNSKNLVKPGDKIKAGQAIALTGRTGRATTEHVHLEVRVNGQYFDPNLVFNFAEHKLKDQCLIFSKKGNKIAVKSYEPMPHQFADNYTYAPFKKKTPAETVHKHNSL